MRDGCKRVLYLAGFATMMSSLWALAHATNLEKQASRRYWPAADPAFFQRVMTDSRAELDEATLPTAHVDGQLID